MGVSFVLAGMVRPPCLSRRLLLLGMAEWRFDWWHFRDHWGRDLDAYCSLRFERRATSVAMGWQRIVACVDSVLLLHFDFGREFSHHDSALGVDFGRIPVDVGAGDGTEWAREADASTGQRARTA